MTDFAAIYGRPAEVEARAPGRVNLIGEHTDYNGGYVLPMALPQSTRASLALRPDRMVRAVSTSLPDREARASYELGREERGRGWIDYVQAVTQVLAEEGHQVPGFDLLIQSDVPVGSGLSSSAALEVSVLRALRTAMALALDDVALARLAWRAETGLVGAPVGMMDQMASSLGDATTALFLDTRTMEYSRVPMPASVELGLVDSGITHQHTSGDYRVRRSECEEAARLLGVSLLSELGLPDLPRVERLPEVLCRRARHVLTENARVLGAVSAMRAGEVQELGRLLYGSHESMRTDFEVSLPEIDLIVEIAANDPDVVGARLTGGGFGGAVLLLCRSGGTVAAARRVAAAYVARTGRPGRVLLPAQR